MRYIDVAQIARLPGGFRVNRARCDARPELAGGGGFADLENSRGVRLRVSGRQIGLMVNIDLSGLQLRLRNN